MVKRKYSYDERCPESEQDVFKGTEGWLQKFMLRHGLSLRRHLQCDIWHIIGKDGRVFFAHCLGCKAGLAEPCSHTGSVLFYIEC